MGIKEFIKQTAENERDNIRDVRIETKRGKKELPFDPALEISEKEWKIVDEAIERAQRTEGQKLSGYFMKLCKKYIQKAGGSEFIIDEEDWRQMTSSWGILHGKQKIFDEKRNREKGDLDQHKWEEELALLEILKEDSNKNFAISRSLPNSAIWQAVAMKILYPQRFSEIEFSQKEWGLLKNSFHKLFILYTGGVMWQGLGMVILEADKVELLRNGLKVTMRSEEFREEPREPRPVRLSFRPK